MKILLSPAKSLDFENAKKLNNTSIPVFINESQEMIKKLQKLSPKKIADLMSVSDTIAELNYERFQEWSFPFNEDSKPALFVFTGEAYRGLDAHNFTEKDIKSANEKLRILSGFYGILKPNDLMLPYRLEMGTKFSVTPKYSNLYKFWGNKITNALNNEMYEGEILVNLASNEYSKVVDFKKIKGEVITCSFKEEKNGIFKAVMTYAKNARGTMSKFIIQNDIHEKEHLKAFDLDNYVFNESLSNTSEFVFTR